MINYKKIVAGVKPGGYKDIYEIRIIICFLLNSVDRPLLKRDINHILQTQEGLINYFTFSQAFEALLNDNQIILVSQKPELKLQFQNSHGYVLTEKGTQTALIFKNDIALTIRERLVKSAKEYIKKLKALEDSQVEIDQVNDGYIVNCRIKDIGSDLIRLSIFSPDKRTASLIRNNFLNRSQKLYEALFQFLTS